MEAEREERERWITREQQKIMESVNGKVVWNFVIFYPAKQSLLEKGRFQIT